MTRSQAGRWGAVAFFALASTWNYLDRSVLAAAAVRIEAEFHLSQAQYGLVSSAYSFCYMLGAPLSGWFLDRAGLETGIVCAVLFWSIASALTGWTRSLGQLVTARMFLGAWESAGVPAAGKLNAIYLEPKNRAIGAAITQVGISVGSMSAPLLVNQFAGWRTSFFVCSVLGLLWIPAWIVVRKNVTPAEGLPLRSGRTGFKLFRDPRLPALAVATMLWMVGYTLSTNWTTIYLVRTFHISDTRANGFAWFPPIAAALGAFLGGWISRRAIARGAEPVRARMFGMLVSAFGCLVILLAGLCPNPAWGTAVVAMSYLWTTAGSVNLYTIPVDIWGTEHAGTAISALVVAYGLLQTIASPIIGYVIDSYGFGPVWWLIALPPLAGWLLLRILPNFRPLPEIVDNAVR